MDKTGFFSALSSHIKANRLFYLFIALIFFSVGGYFWWRAGFTLDFSRFFAAGVEVSVNSAQPLKHGERIDVSWSALWADSCDASAWINTGGANEGRASSDPINACAASTGSFVINCSRADGTTGNATVNFSVDQSTCPSATHLACVNNACAQVSGSGSNQNGCTFTGQACGGDSSPAPTPSSASASCPCGAGSWGSNGVTVCKTGGNIDTANRCTNLSPGAQASVDITICNNSGSHIYSREALFYSPTQTCGALATNPGHGSVTGDTSLQPGQIGRVTYSFNTGECGAWQEDDTWHSDAGFTVFVIGQVINTGRSCPTPTPTVTTTITPTPSPTPSPTTSPTISPTTTPTPTTTSLPVLSCAAETSQVNVGQTAYFTVTGAGAQVSWFAPGGNPSSQDSVIRFGTVYNTPGFKTVTVASGGNQAACSVNVLPVQTSPSTSPQSLVCSPVSQEKVSGQPATITASGGSGNSSTDIYSWQAPNGSPTTGTGSSFTTVFTNTTEPNRVFPVTVTSGQMSATCNVNVACPAAQCPAPSNGCYYQGGNRCTCGTLVCPSGPTLSLTKLVRNISQNSAEVDSVNANPSDTVEFVVRITANGNSNANDIVARDTLPSGLSYQGGTTTIDGAPAADGLMGSGLGLGSMSPGRTITLRFRATVAPASYFPSGTTALVNTAYAQGSNVGQVSDTAFVNVARGGQNLSMSLTKTGRNLTKGQQTGEFTSINASPDDAMEFVLRIRNTSQSVLTNVIVRDILPQGIIYQPGTARLNNNQTISDTLVSSGVNIGSLAVGQEAVISFTGRAASAHDLPSGTTTLINTAQASADSVPTLTAQLPIIITNSAIVVPPVSTGPGESTILALIVSAIITLLYVGYTGTDTFRRREAGQLAKEARKDRGLFDFRR